MLYNPCWGLRGINAEGGLYMLVAQAVYASEIFRDVTIPKTEIERIFGEVLKMKENIALTGMPASGKSAAGRYLAQLLGRELIDTDDEIVRRTGREIPEIFEKTAKRPSATSRPRSCATYAAARGSSSRPAGERFSATKTSPR